jgi:hypothetical protein
MQQTRSDVPSAARKRKLSCTIKREVHCIKVLIVNLPQASITVYHSGDRLRFKYVTNDLSIPMETAAKLNTRKGLI